MTSHLKSASGTPALKWLVKICFHLAMSSGVLRPEKTPPGSVAPNQNSWRTCSTATLAPGAVRITSVPIRFLAMDESRSASAAYMPAAPRSRSEKTDFRIPMAVNLARFAASQVVDLCGGACRARPGGNPGLRKRRGSGQFRRPVVAALAPDGGLQLRVFGRIAAGGQIEVVVADSRVDVVHRRCIRRKTGLRERRPDAVRSARPAVAEAGGAALAQALAVSAEILDEGIEARKRRAAGDCPERRQVLPDAGLVQEEPGGEGGLVAIHGGLHHEFVGLADLPVVIEEALPAGPLAPEPPHQDVVGVVERFHAPVGGNAALAVLGARVPHREQNHPILAGAKLLDAEVTLAEPAGHEVTAGYGFLDRQLVIENRGLRPLVPQVNRTRRARLGRRLRAQKAGQAEQRRHTPVRTHARVEWNPRTGAPDHAYLPFTSPYSRAKWSASGGHVPQDGPVS